MRQGWAIEFTAAIKKKLKTPGPLLNSKVFCLWVRDAYVCGVRYMPRLEPLTYSDPKRAFIR